MTDLRAKLATVTQNAEMVALTKELASWKRKAEDLQKELAAGAVVPTRMQVDNFRPAKVAYPPGATAETWWYRIGKRTREIHVEIKLPDGQAAQAIVYVRDKP